MSFQPYFSTAIESYFSITIDYNLAMVSRLTALNGRYLWNIKEGVRLDKLSSLNLKHITTIDKDKIELSKYLNCKMRSLNLSSVERIAKSFQHYSTKHPIYCEDEYTALIIDSSITEWDETNLASSSFLSLVCSYYNIYNGWYHQPSQQAPMGAF